jgi:hypothetical protein
MMSSELIKLFFSCVARVIIDAKHGKRVCDVFFTHRSSLFSWFTVLHNVQCGDERKH